MISFSQTIWNTRISPKTVSRFCDFSFHYEQMFLLLILQNISQITRYYFSNFQFKNNLCFAIKSNFFSYLLQLLDERALIYSCGMISNKLMQPISHFY